MIKNKNKAGIEKTSMLHSKVANLLIAAPLFKNWFLYVNGTKEEKRILESIFFEGFQRFDGKQEK